MTGFWFLSLALLAIALLFIFAPVLPFFRKENNQEVQESETVSEARKHQNVLIFKERFAELEAEFSAGKHSEETYQQLKAELEATLLIDVEEHESAVEKRDSIKQSATGLSAGNLATLLVSAIIVVAVSYGGYFKWGAYEEVRQVTGMGFDEHEIQQARSAAESGDMSSLLKQLYNKLQQSPDNLEGWTLLTRSAMNTEHYPLAIEAYQQIIRILSRADENTASVYGLLAQAYYYQNNGQLNTDVQKALDQAFEQNPNEVNSLGLMAIEAYSSNDFENAIVFWKRILIASPEHPSRASIETGIARAQASLGVAPDQNDVSQTKDTQQAKAEIIVQVSINPEVLVKVNPQDTVFIFASPVSSAKGPAMPLAASRHKVSDLPITVTLNDQSAMGPMAKLSQVSKANVVARISKTGQPIAQAGDFEGLLSSVDVYANKIVEIQISKEL